LDAGDYFSLVRQELLKWGGQVMVLPLGIEPVGIGRRTDGPLALSLLARAAPNAISKDRLGVLFDSETMRPRITEPAFVNALTQMVQSSDNAEKSEEATAITVPVLGYSDRLVAVTNSSRNAASAFKLLEWLATSDISSQLASAGDGTLPVRRSLASSPSWYGSQVPASERDDVAKSLRAAMEQPKCLLFPRIPGVDDYTAALEEAVESAVREGVPPRDALANAAEKWEKITDTLGRDSQRQAYLKHLGIADP
jgi:hypothetical protein